MESRDVEERKHMELKVAEEEKTQMPGRHKKKTV